MDGHLERHIGISALAMAVGLLVVAWRPERARAMLPILGVLVVGPRLGLPRRHLGRPAGPRATCWRTAPTSPGSSSSGSWPAPTASPNGPAVSGRCSDERIRRGPSAGWVGPSVERRSKGAYEHSHRVASAVSSPSPPSPAVVLVADRAARPRPTPSSSRPTRARTRTSPPRRRPSRSPSASTSTCGATRSGCSTAR